MSLWEIFRNTPRLKDSTLPRVAHMYSIRDAINPSVSNVPCTYKHWIVTLDQLIIMDSGTVIRGYLVFPGLLGALEWTFRKKTKLLTAFHTDYRTFHQVHHFEDKSFNFKISWNSTFSDKNCGRYDIKREDFFWKKNWKKHDFFTSINKPSTAQTT